MTSSTNYNLGVFGLNRHMGSGTTRMGKVYYRRRSCRRRRHCCKSRRWARVVVVAGWVGKPFGFHGWRLETYHRFGRGGFGYCLEDRKRARVRRSFRKKLVG